jgi:hypothetical protein
MKWKYALDSVKLGKGESVVTASGLAWMGLIEAEIVLNEHGNRGWEIVALIPDGDGRATVLLRKPFQDDAMPAPLGEPPVEGF